MERGFVVIDGEADELNHTFVYAERLHVDARPSKLSPKVSLWARTTRTRPPVSAVGFVALGKRSSARDTQAQLCGDWLRDLIRSLSDS